MWRTQNSWFGSSKPSRHFSLFKFPFLHFFYLYFLVCLPLKTDTYLWAKFHSLCWNYAKYLISPSGKIWNTSSNKLETHTYFLLTMPVLLCCSLKMNWQRLIHCWWEYQIIWLLQKTVWQFLKDGPAIPLLGTVPKITDKQTLQQYLLYIHCSIIAKKWKQYKCSNKEQIKSDYVYREIYFL